MQEKITLYVILHQSQSSSVRDYLPVSSEAQHNRSYDGYTIFKIKATQIGKITDDYIASAFPGGTLTFTVSRKLYDGNVEIETIRAGKIGYTEKASDLDFIFDYSKFLGAV